jgi:hypothetical protein
MTRFDLLAILDAQARPISCARIAELNGWRDWYRRSFQADLATRLRKLYKWGLLRRRNVSARRLWGGRAKYLWSISERSRARLEWAQGRYFVEVFKQAMAKAVEANRHESHRLGVD